MYKNHKENLLKNTGPSLKSFWFGPWSNSGRTHSSPILYLGNQSLLMNCQEIKISSSVWVSYFWLSHLLHLKLLIEFNIPIFTLILIQKEESSAVGKSIKLLITINMMKVEKFYITINL